jgi:hypothetical protein
MSAPAGPSGAEGGFVPPGAGSRPVPSLTGQGSLSWVVGSEVFRRSPERLSLNQLRASRRGEAARVPPARSSPTTRPHSLPRQGGNDAAATTSLWSPWQQPSG